MTINLFLQVLGLVCMLLAAVSVPVPRVSLLALGLFFWFLATLV